MNENRQRKATRFSIRSLLVVPVLVGVYFACGPPTKSRGVADVTAYQRANDLHQISPNYVAPLVLKCWVSTRDEANGTTTKTTTYYVWFFGFVKQLPFDRVQTASDVVGASHRMGKTKP